MKTARLLLDKHNIARTELVEQVPGTVEKHPANPLMCEDKPWEPRWDDMKPSVWRDPQTGRTHLWYTPFIYDSCTTERHAAPWHNRQPWPPEEVRYHKREPGWFREFALCYAYSDDGITWIKPELGMTAFEGLTANNILMREPRVEGHDDVWMSGVIGSGVGFDARERDHAKRFKMVCGAGAEPPLMNERGIAVAYSADGLHWTSPRRVLPPDAWADGRGTWGDAHNTWFFSEPLQRYVAITQGWDPGGCRRRLKLRMESENFETWSDPEPLTFDPDVEVHTHVPFIYRGLSLALAHRVTTPDGLGDGTVDVELAYSDDTKDWQLLTSGTPLIPRGGSGERDCGCIFAAMSPIEVDDEIRLYYCANDGTIRGWRRSWWHLAILKRDRWLGFRRVPLDPPGVIETPVQTLTSHVVTLNAEAQLGCISVEMLDPEGHVLATSHRVTGDGLDLPVTWAEPAAARAAIGKPVVLRFLLRSATLFAYDNAL